jgi:DNA primase
LAEGQPEIILCESLIDALTFIAAGFENVTTSYGINGFTDEILAALKESGAQRILIAYDADAGRQPGRRETGRSADGRGLRLLPPQLPQGHGRQRIRLKVQPPMKSLGLVIRKAEWLGKGERPDLHTAAPAMLARESAGGLKLQSRLEPSRESFFLSC